MAPGTENPLEMYMRANLLYFPMSVYNTNTYECVPLQVPRPIPLQEPRPVPLQGPKPEPLKPKQAEEEDHDADDSDEEDADDSDEEDEENEDEMPPNVVSMFGTLSLEPFKILRRPNRVMLRAGEIVPAIMQVVLDNGQVIILDGCMGVVHGQYVVNVDQTLRDRDLMLGMRPEIPVEGELDIDPGTLQNTASSCGIVNVPAEIRVAPNLMIETTPQFGQFGEAARYPVVSNDFPVHAKALFQAHAVHAVQHMNFVRQYA
jgi:hypothetical protein